MKYSVNGKHRLEVVQFYVTLLLGGRAVLRHPPACGRVGRGSGRGGSVALSLRATLPARSSRPSRGRAVFNSWKNQGLCIPPSPREGREERAGGFAEFNGYCLKLSALADG